MHIDKQMMQLMDDDGVLYRLVLTKADLIPPRELEAVVAKASRVAASFRACDPCLHLVSGKNGSGVDELRLALTRAAFPGLGGVLGSP